jgi:hypothetical protein
MGIPYSYSEPLPVDNDGGMGAPAAHGDAASDKVWEPAAVVAMRRYFRDNKPKAWRKKDLGWAGACKTILQLYKLQKPEAMPPAVRRTPLSRARMGDRSGSF